MIRQATKQDIPKLAELETQHFRENGYGEATLSRFLSTFPAGFLVAEENDVITGYTFFEVLKKDQVSAGFRIAELNEPIREKWAHCLAFTTQSQYRNAEEDSQLLQRAESIVVKHGCREAYVPLPIQHPQPEAYAFWKSHGYEKVGKIIWDSHTGTVFESWFCRKKL